MLIQGAFMYVEKSVSADRFLKFLADEAPAGHYFLAKPPAGVIMTGAIDWRVILTDSKAVEALATALWSGYQTLVKPLQDSRAKPGPHIFIQIKNVKGGCDQFTLGKEIDNKDVFLHRVRESAAALCLKHQETAARQQIERTAGSDYWLAFCRPLS